MIAGWPDDQISRFLLPSLFLDLDIQPLDLLIERGKWHPEVFRRFGLVPVALFQHLGDEVSLAILDHVE